MPHPLLITVFSKLLQALCKNDYHRFTKSLDYPKESQDRLFQKLLHDLKKTQYGQSYKITGNETYQEFVAKLPIQSYDTLEPTIQKQLTSRQKVLTPHRVIHTEPTSGSSGAVKLIPYTGALLKSFATMFRIWTYDLLTHGFTPEVGRIFISISPLSNQTNQQGFSDEREFLPEPLRSLISPFLVLPPKQVSPNQFQKTMAITLLKESSLEIISIWSPSYLLVLLEYIQLNRESLAKHLPEHRAYCLNNEQIDWQHVWPKLKLISCWDSASSKTLAQQLQSLFPSVLIQGKGLLATEAPITIPLLQASGHVPLLNDVFLEFEIADGQIKRLHELSDGDQAELIISQQGGLTRYRLNDVVTVAGFYHHTPCLKFVGRANQTSDLAGEKLTEHFVSQALNPIIPTKHYTLVPYQAQTQSRYILLTNNINEDMAEQAEAALCQAHHYQYAQQLKQLAPLQVIHVAELPSKLLAFHQQEGMKLGNIKDKVLITDLFKAKRLLSFLQCLPNATQVNTGSLLNR